MGGIFAHGVSFGYINLSATEGIGQQTIDISVNSFPIYYAPKVMFGNERFKGFIKGATWYAVCQSEKGRTYGGSVTLISDFTGEEEPE